MYNGFLSRLCWLLIVLLLPGCASVFGPVEDPRISIVSVRVLPVSGAEQRIELGLRVMNPNGFDLKARGLVVDVGFNDISVLSGVAADLPVVPAYSEALVNVTLSASLLNGIRLVSSLMKNPDVPLQYRLEARLDLSAPVGRQLTVLQLGEIDARAPAPQNEAAL